MTLPGTDKITSLLTTYLDVQSKRSEVISANIANAETPGYHARELDFAAHLRQAAADATAPQPAAASAASQNSRFTETARVVEQPLPEVVRLDGNTVDMRREMSALAETGMQYLAGTQMLQSRLRLLRAAIREGR